MNNDGGYTRLYRRVWDNPAFRSKQEAAVFAWMVSAAQWKAGCIRSDKGPISLDVGELAVSERQIAEDFGLHRNVVRRLMARMVESHMVVIKRSSSKNGTSSGTIITITNYAEYQGISEERDQQPDQLGTSSGPARDQPIKTKEGKEGKEENPPLPPKGGKAIAEEFDVFWKACPKKEGKGAAYKKYLIARRTATADQLLQGIKDYSIRVAGKDIQYIVQPARWLHEKRWKDEDAPSNVVDFRDRPTGPPPTPEEIAKLRAERGALH